MDITSDRKAAGRSNLAVVVIVEQNDLLLQGTRACLRRTGNSGFTTVFRVGCKSEHIRAVSCPFGGIWFRFYKSGVAWAKALVCHRHRKV